MKEIAKVVGVALSRVSQIRQEIMVKLRVSLDHLQASPMPMTVNNRRGYYEHA
jgi:DNA-directed RNA polymerase sigma subunit (sigma70/sigma32)